MATEYLSCPRDANVTAKQHCTARNAIFAGAEIDFLDGIGICCSMKVIQRRPRK
jgi:hypothetical protein